MHRWKGRSRLGALTISGVIGFGVLGCSNASDCGAEPVHTRSTAPKSAPPSSQLDVEMGGCVTLLDQGDGGLECIFDHHHDLRIWVFGAAHREAQILVDGEPVAAPPDEQPQESGRGFDVAPVCSGRRVEVRLRDGTTWSRRIRSLDALTVAERSWRQRYLDETLTVENRLYAGEVGAMPDADRLVEQGLRDGYWGDAMNFGMATGYYLTFRMARFDRAQSHLEPLHAEARRDPATAASTMNYLARLLEHRGRFSEAAVMYRWALRTGLRLHDDGILTDGLGPYVKVLTRLGYFDAAKYWSEVLQRHVQNNTSPHNRARLLEMLAQEWLQAKQQGYVGGLEPQPMFEEALAWMTANEPSISGATMLGLVELHLFERNPAEARRQLAELSTLLKRLETSKESEASRVAMTVDEQARLVALEVRVAVSSEAPAGVIDASLDKLDALAERAVDPHTRWLAALVRGEVLEGRGELFAAVAAYEQAEEVLDSLIPLAALGGSGEAADARHAEGRRRLLSLLLLQGQEADALCVARHGQARLSQLAVSLGRMASSANADTQERLAEFNELRYRYEAMVEAKKEMPVDELQRAQEDARRLRELAQQLALELLPSPGVDAVRPTCDQLTPRRPGEMLLGLYPLGKDLLVFVSDDQGTTHQTIEGMAGQPQAEQAERIAEVLRSQDERVSAAERIRVLASHQFQAVDVHALPWRGSALIRNKPVVYGLELAPLAQRSPDATSKSATVLTDDTVVSSQVAEAAVARLERGYDEVSLLESAGSRPDAVRDVLTRTDHLYYLGHAYYAGTAPGAERDGAAVDVEHLWPPYPGGAASEPAFIPVGTDAGRLEVADILMLERVPRTVMLMGCATGVSDLRASQGGFSLAAAFLGAGAHAVVASTRKVGRADAFGLGDTLAANVANGAERPGYWMQRSVNEAIEGGLPLGAVADYRVFVP